MTTRLASRGLIPTLILGAILASAACGSPSAPTDSGQPAPGDTAAGSFGEGSTPAEPAGGGGEEGGNPGPEEPPAVTYPGTAREYAEAVLASWADGAIETLGSLTTAGVQEQIMEIPAPVNHVWTFLRCDGAAGTQYCAFANADGNEVILGVVAALLGQAHATTSVMYDVVEFPNDGVAYVKEFVAAWQVGNTARMLKLSKPEVVAKLKKNAPLSPTYPDPTCCGGGLLQVKVKAGSVTDLFDVGTTLLGGPHAILDYQAGQLGKI